MAAIKKIKFVSAGYYHTDLRYMYRYKDADGKLYDLYEDEIYRYLHVGDAEEVEVAPEFMDLFPLREVGDYNYLTRKWNWKYE